MKRLAAVVYLGLISAVFVPLALLLAAACFLWSAALAGMLSLSLSRRSADLCLE